LESSRDFLTVSKTAQIRRKRIAALSSLIAFILHFEKNEKCTL